MIHSLIKEPLLHFTVAGLAIFGLFALTNDDLPPPAANDIIVTQADARWLAEQFEATWLRAPQPSELDALIDNFVQEEMYVREALALGLDQNDTVVRRRLHQKMEFISEASVASAIPDDATLKAFYEANKDSFVTPGRIAFRQILVPGDAASADALRAKLNTGGDPLDLGAPTLLPHHFPSSIAPTVDGTFGPGFFQQISNGPLDSWHGPVASSFGLHLVKVEALTAATVPAFEDIKNEVTAQWRANEMQSQRNRFLENLKAAYTVTRPDAAEVLQ